MGQKVNPIGLRVGINRTWDSRWFSAKDYAAKLIEDLKLRKFVTEKLKAAGISKVIVERAAKNTRVTVHTARPGVIIGKKGSDIEKLRKDLSTQSGSDVSLNIERSVSRKLMPSLFLRGLPNSSSAVYRSAVP